MARAVSLPDLEKQKLRVLAAVAEVETWLGLDWLDVKHLFNEGEPDEDMLAHTVGKMQYRYAEITWYLYNVLMVEDSTLWGTVIHEYVHVLLSGVDKYLPLSKPYVTDANEFGVESVAQAILHALRTPPPDALG